MSILGPILGVLGVGGIGAALVFVPGLAGAVAKLASAAVSFVVNLPWAKIWWTIPLGIAAVVIFIQGHKLGNRDETIAAQAVKLKQVQSAFDATVAGYRAAAAKATADDAANKARVEAAQQQATKEVSNDYEARLAALRAAYDKRLQQPSGPKANPGGPGVAPVSGPRPAPGGPDGSPASRDELGFNCQANSLQLEELQRWVREQVAIPVDATKPQ